MKVSRRTESVKLIEGGVPHIWFNNGLWVMTPANNPSFHGRQITILASEFVQRLNKQLTK